METQENKKFAVDANGKEIRVGSFGRLSEAGREKLRSENPKLISELPNLRFKILDVKQETGDILCELTETRTPLGIIFNCSLIIVENY